MKQSQELFLLISTLRLLHPISIFFGRDVLRHTYILALIQALSRMSGYGRMRRKTEEAREGLDHYDLNTVNVVLRNAKTWPAVWPRL